MCILFFYTNPRPEYGHYRLILASNRDEYFMRNAQEAHKWSDNPQIISGIDLETGREGGTWLGLSIDQSETNVMRIGALLNVTGEPRITGASGRGFIVTEYLKNPHISTHDYLNQLKCATKEYNAFNFVAVEVGMDKCKSFHYSNAGNHEILEYDSPMVLGFGNSLPEKPLSKVEAGKKRFQEIICKYDQVLQSEQLISNLIDLLKWDQRHLPDEELQRRAPNMYEYLSSVYVHVPTAGYGTRTHSIILVDWQGEVQYVEHTMDCPIDEIKPTWIQQDIRAHL